jgi:hypothetical protein
MPYFGLGTTRDSLDTAPESPNASIANGNRNYSYYSTKIAKARTSATRRPGPHASASFAYDGGTQRFRIHLMIETGTNDTAVTRLTCVSKTQCEHRSGYATNGVA